MNKIQQARIALSAEGALFNFMSAAQRIVLAKLLQGEEAEAMADKVLEYVERIVTMPKTYETDGLGMRATAHLHYFMGGADAWITEKDQGDQSLDMEQHQAFGLMSLGGGPGEGELGYISIQELIENGFELDLYWTPQALEDI